MLQTTEYISASLGRQRPELPGRTNSRQCSPLSQLWGLDPRGLQAYQKHLLKQGAEDPFTKRVEHRAHSFNCVLCAEMPWLDIPARYSASYTMPSAWKVVVPGK